MKKTFIIIVVLIIIGVGVYYIVSKNNSNVTPNTPTSTTQSPSTPTPAAPASNTPTTPTPSSVTVSIKNFSFNPSTLTIKTGTKVTWVNDDAVSHTITSDTGNLLHSPTLSPGQSFNFTFTNAGSVNYHCNIHPTMKGVVIAEN